MMDLKQVIIIRKDLNMRKGKMIAQGSHASEGAIFQYMVPNYLDPGPGPTRTFTITLPEGDIGEEMYGWMTGMFKKIVVSTDTLGELIAIYQQAKTIGLPCSIIEDKGLTEFGGEITITACAIGPCKAERIDPITKHLKLL